MHLTVWYTCPQGQAGRLMYSWLEAKGLTTQVLEALSKNAKDCDWERPRVGTALRSSLAILSSWKCLHAAIFPVCMPLPLLEFCCTTQLSGEARRIVMGLNDDKDGQVSCLLSCAVTKKSGLDIPPDDRRRMSVHDRVRVRMHVRICRSMGCPWRQAKMEAKEQMAQSRCLPPSCPHVS